MKEKGYRIAKNDTLSEQIYINSVIVLGGIKVDQKRNQKATKGYKEKISIIKSKPVLQYSLNLEFIQEFPSQTYAGKIINKPQSAISECCSGKRESAYGFIWKYKKN